MSIQRVALVATMALNLSYAKIDFVNFGDICESKISKSCKNKEVEIKAIQYLLKKRVNPKIEVNGKLDNLTKETIISLQLKEKLPPSGYIGKETKDVLNKLLYGHKLHQNIAKKESNFLNKVTKKSKVATIVRDANGRVTLKVSDIKKLKSSTTVSQKVAQVNKVKKSHFKNYREFVKSIDLKKSYAVYQDPKLLKRAGKSNTLLKIDVNKQRVKLVVNGKVALDAPCTTGAKRKFEPNTKTYRDKHTPKGTFKIMEKIAVKRSTIFGDIYKNGRKIYHGDRRKYKGSWKGAKFVGHPLKNWMRLTSGGIGLHASNFVKRYPGSNGCIRLQPKVARLIFKKIKPGTKVKVN